MRFGISMCVLGCVVVGLVGTAAAWGECDPQELAKLLASDASSRDYFGGSLAVSGETAVIGAPGDDDGGSAAGAAYIFVRSGGVWTQQVKLTASDAAADDSFGGSVAISGDTAVIGARQDDHAGGTDAGSAYVFVGSGGVWSQQAKLTASDAATYDRFGCSVGVSGDTVIIGAYADDSGDIDAGSAYVFVRSGGIWTQQARLTYSVGEREDRFGVSVAIFGDTAVIGADEDSAVFGPGFAVVFVRSSGVWIQQAKLVASDAAVGDGFGAAVAVSGETAVIGAHWDEHAGGWWAGSAYVFVRSGGVWTQEAKLTASDAGVFDSLGDSVAVSGETAVIGAYGGNQAAGTNAGSAYVFVRSGGVWTEQAKLTASDAAAGDRFGASLAVSGDTALIGAYGDSEGGSYAGAAYVFELGCHADNDDDGVLDDVDNCPWDYNPDQADCNGNGVGDVCDLCGALDADLDVDVNDYFVLVAAFGRVTGDPLFNDCADYDGDGVITFIDYQEWLLCYQAANGKAFALPRPTPAAAERTTPIGPTAGEFGGARPMGK